MSSTPDIAACDRSNAVDTMNVPEEFGNPVTCLMHGQAFLAQMELGRDMTAGERVKVVCVRSPRRAADASLTVR